MTRNSISRTVYLCALFLLSLGSSSAFADDCVALGGTIVAGQCRISSIVSKSGSFTLDETLRILGNGRINVPAAGGGNTLDLTITGDLIVDVPTLITRGRISGDVSGATAIGATITVNATGDIRLEGGATTGGRISSVQTSSTCTTGRGGNLFLHAGGSVIAERNAALSVNARCPAGEIEIEAPNVEVAGQVLSESAIGGSGTNRPGGGPITVNAGCSLLVDQTGVIRSKGADPGADLVHLQAGCDVTIYGLVASTGQGHVPPGNPVNRCHGVNKPLKDPDSAGCVEIWAGNSLTIDSVGSRAGQVHADISQAGGGVGLAWLDLFVRGDINILGDTAGPYAVHSNGAVANSRGGDIRIYSRLGKIAASRRAVQANALVSGGKGGDIDIQSKLDLDLTNAIIQARGGTLGAGRAGGKILLRSHAGNLLGLIASQVNASGGPPIGAISLNACNVLNFLGNTFGITPGTLLGACAEDPPVPVQASLPICTCGELPPAPDVQVEKVGNGTITAGDTASFTIKVTNLGPGEATNVVLTDTLPGNLTWQENPDLPDCTITGNALDCQIGNMAENEAFEVTVEALTSSADCGDLPNTATVEAENEPDNLLENNRASDTIVVNCPDLRIVKESNTTPVDAGDLAIFTMTVTNLGPGTATNVTLSDQLPGGLSWVETPDHPDCSINVTNLLTCSFGDLADNASESVTVQATTSVEACGDLPNTASVEGTNEDPDKLDNNEDSATITVECPLCPTVPQEDGLVCLDQPLGTEEAECAFFGEGAPLGKDQSPANVPHTASMNAAYAIVKMGSGQTECSEGQQAYRIYSHVSAGDLLDAPEGGDSISHVTYCGCPEED